MQIIGRLNGPRVYLSSHCEISGVLCTINLLATIYLCVIHNTILFGDISFFGKKIQRIQTFFNFHFFRRLQVNFIWRMNWTFGKTILLQNVFIDDFLSKPKFQIGTDILFILFIVAFLWVLATSTNSCFLYSTLYHI